MCVVNYGDDAGKLCVIIEVVDRKRVFVDGPESLTGLSRQIYPLKRLTLTEYVLPLSERSAPAAEVEAAFEKEDIAKKFAESAMGRKLANRKRKAELNDFERFQVRTLKAKFNATVRAELKEMQA